MDRLTEARVRALSLQAALEKAKHPTGRRRVPGDGDGDGIPNESKKPGGSGGGPVLRYGAKNPDKLAPGEMMSAGPGGKVYRGMSYGTAIGTLRTVNGKLQFVPDNNDVPVLGRVEN